MSDIIKTQRSLALKAEHQPQHQFDHLYRLICREDWLMCALKSVLSNQGAKTAGIDGITKKTLEKKTAQAEFLRELQEQLRSKQFRPLPVRRVYIPKEKRKTETLGHSRYQGPSSTNVAKNVARTNLRKRLLELFQRVSTPTQNTELYRPTR